METKLKWIENPMKKPLRVEKKEQLVNKEISGEVKRFHESFDEYKVTPLRELSDLSSYLNIGSIHVKDEAYRFGLNAFKVLGASYAMGKCLAKRLGCSIDEIPFPVLKNPEIREKLGDITFAATTDGNHGRGVAWTAQQLDFDATIYMPKGTTQQRFQHIVDTGAKAAITEYNYDDTVRWVAKQAKKHNWEVIQDTAWEGYEDVPKWIMQGYSTMAREVIEQMGAKRPTHVLLQAGVGAFAAVMTSVLLEAYADAPPKIILLEAQIADCFYQSISQGEVVPATGDLNTIMAGLACGEPNPLAWEILKEDVDVFISAPDWVTAQGMRILGNPLGKDDRVVSGESGAVGIGAISVIAKQQQYEDLKKVLNLNESSVVLAFSTEGDTDTTTYREIVWDGKYPSEA